MLLRYFTLSLAVVTALIVFPRTTNAQPLELTKDLPITELEEAPSKTKDIIVRYRERFYGRLTYIAPDLVRIVVSPQEDEIPQGAHELKRLSFYIDKRTKFWRDNKEFEAEKLALGRKVAVLFVGEGNIRVASHVFLVDGEYLPAEYTPPKPRLKPKPKPPELEEGEAEAADQAKH